VGLIDVGTGILLIKEFRQHRPVLRSVFLCPTKSMSSSQCAPQIGTKHFRAYGTAGTLSYSLPTENRVSRYAILFLGFEP
jgi:hypothetical protein